MKRICILILAIFSLSTSALAQTTRNGTVIRNEVITEDIRPITEGIAPGVPSPVVIQTEGNRPFVVRRDGGQQVEFQRLTSGANGQNFTFISSLANGPVVRGAPYSAEAVNETIQTLGDGNRIVQRQVTKIARDGQGRERREEGDPAATILITDPVEGKSYNLNPELKTATIGPSFMLTVAQPFRTTSGDASHNTEINLQHEVNFAGGVHVMSTPFGVGTGLDYTYGVPAAVRPMGEGSEVVQKNLGTQNIEGVAAEGMRTTLTIPAGEIGNVRPIEVVDERWYSPELQTTVMTRHSDPRSGETTFKLTKIQRVEPATTLFTVPSEYTVIDRTRNATFRYAAPAAEQK